jgi:cbb3-type cytochrome oxidase maturation protein
MFKSIIILIVLSLCIGTGAWLLFIWTVKRGDFDDVEGPKYRMLDEEDDEIKPPEGDNHD